MTSRVRLTAVTALLTAALGLGVTACAVMTGTTSRADTAPVVAATERAEAAVAEVGDGPLSVEEAGELYLALVEPTNTMLDEFDSAIAVSDMDRLRAVSGDLADGYEELADGLEAAQWPEPVQGAVSALVLEVETEAPAWRAVADAETDAETADRLAEVPPVGRAAQVVRRLLGLDGAQAG